MITQRFATVEPVLGNLRGNKRLHRWHIMGMPHDKEKLCSQTHTILSVSSGIQDVMGKLEMDNGENAWGVQKMTARSR
jgi:hypothetical protein